jgi:DNA-binding NtrC family response regulator
MGERGKIRVYKWPGEAKPASTAPPRQGRTLHELLALHERVILIQALQMNHFSRTRAAESLGVSRNYLWRRMRMLRIDFSVLPRTTPGRPRKRTV